MHPSRSCTLSFRRPWRVLAALSLLFPTVSAQTLVTDADDYAPGETVYFAGAGFQAGETVGISLHVETADDEVIDYAIGGILVDGGGEFTASWLVPVEALDSSITATALGLSSGAVAVAKFTDSHGTHNVRFETAGLPAGLSITISGSRRNPGNHNSSPYSVTFNTPGPSSNTGAQAQGGVSTVSYTGFPAMVLGVGGDYWFQSSTPASGFATGAAGGLTTVTATYTFVPSVVCPVNNAPTIFGENIHLGDVVGVFDGSSFSHSTTVVVTTTTSDPDGDPVSVTYDGSVTISGPGMGSAVITLTATDDPSARNHASCATLSPMSATTTVTVTARVIYAVEVLPPLTANGNGLFKRGSTIPMKFRVRDARGVEIPPTAFAMESTNRPSLGAVVVSSLSTQGATLPTDPSESGDLGIHFRYSGTCGVDGHWHYNLSTQSAGWSIMTYVAKVALNDGTVRGLCFGLKK